MSAAPPRHPSIGVALTDVPPVRHPLGLVDVDDIGEPLNRPRARGWIHLVSTAVAAVAGSALLWAAWLVGARAGWAILVYVIGVIGMFGISAAYHRVQWGSAGAEKWMRRLDHSAIFLFIAATYTPFAVLAMPPDVGARVLGIVWAGALAGVAVKMLWPNAPRWVGVPLYLLLGYVAVWFTETLLAGAGVTVVALLVAGAVLYSIGAVFYGARWPNPWPTTFGHHEFFHACVAAAATCHFVAIWLVVH